jgi:hypothetical protein
MTYRWVCICRTTLDGAEYNIGDIWPGTGKSPVGSPSWAPVAMGDGSIPVPVNTHEAQPYPDFSSDEAALRTIEELAAWRARGN